MNLDRVHLDDSSVAYSAGGWAGLRDPGWHYSHGTLVSMLGGGCAQLGPLNRAPVSGPSSTAALRRLTG